VSQVDSPAPRAEFFPLQRVRYLDRPTIHRRLRDVGFDLTQNLLLPLEAQDSNASGRSAAAAAAAAAARARPATLTYRRPDTDRIECTVVAEQDGFVRVIESWDPGWSAMVDGTPAPIWPALDALLAVKVSAGTHEVRFEYATPGAGAGIAVSVVCAGALAIWALWIERKQRPTAPVVHA
jgi:hypothetical protein